MRLGPEQRPDRAAVRVLLRRARAAVPEPEGTAALRSYVAAMFPGAPVLDGLLTAMRDYLGAPEAASEIATATATSPALSPAAATAACASEAASAAPAAEPEESSAPPAAPVAAEPEAPTLPAPAPLGVPGAASPASPTHVTTAAIFASQPARAGKEPDLYSAGSPVRHRDIFASRGARPPEAEPGRDIFAPPPRAAGADIFASPARAGSVEGTKSDPFSATGRTPNANAFATQNRAVSAGAPSGSDPFAAARENAVAQPDRDLLPASSGADPFARRGNRPTGATGVPAREGDVFAQDRRPPASVGGDPFAARTAVKDELPRWPALQAPRPSPRGRAEPREERARPEPRPEEDRPPSESALRFDAGLLALRNGNMTEALRLWSEAVELDPGNRTYQVNLQRLRTIGEKR
jgi:hypothetical protein